MTTILDRVIDRFSKATNTTRPPVSSGIGGIGFGNQTVDAPRVSLDALNASSWLFAVVDKISSSVGAADWTLLQSLTNNDDREMPSDHPLNQLWNDPNPFYSNNEMLEVLDNHFEHVGEMWIVIVRNMGVPIELWPVRPDRMKPIPDPREFVRGYVYTVGREKLFLDVDDVIFIRRPSPVNPYRGIGVIGSLINDIAGDEAAARWMNAFWRNSVTLSGVMEFDEGIEDDDADRLVQQFHSSYKGVNNAFKVAFLERAKWTSPTYNIRNTQVNEYRFLTRDIVNFAFGMPQSVMGVSENVNRANAEAGLVMFNQNLIIPRLRRIEASINKQLCPMFGDDLHFEFVDPTPENREQNMKEAIAGYRAGLLTKNEGRRRLEEGEDPDGGDEYIPQLTGPRGGEIGGDGVTTESFQKALVQKEDPLLSDPIERAESDMRRNWERRLDAELVSLLREIESRENIQISDVDLHDWNWWEKYGDEVTTELSGVFSLAVSQQFPTMPSATLAQLSSAYARARAAELIRVDGSVNVVQSTRASIRELVARTVENGDSLQTLTKELRESFGFSASRADMIARTETATALGQGHKQAAINQGRDEKHWVTQGDDAVEGDCLSNEADGWIAVNDSFSTGVDTIPQHPRCRCVVRYRTSKLHQEALQITERVHCPNCNRRMPVNNLKGSASIYCRQCAQEFEV